MKSLVRMLGVLCLPLFLMSVTLVKSPGKNHQSNFVKTISGPVATIVEKPVRQTIFQKLIARLIKKQLSKNIDQGKADKLANTSLILGISSLVALVAAVAIPSLLLLILMVPLGIGAIVTGSAALKKGTGKEISAKLGKGFAYSALGASVLLLILAAVILSSSNWW